MYKGKRFLAIIPARGGSKGLPKKNIKSLLGKPLIAWTIEQALNSKYLDEVIVNTDDKEIAKISEAYGAKIPFIRPKNLALDETPTFDVIEHTVEFYKEKLNDEFDYIVLLEPTSPLREVYDIDRAIEILLNNKNAKAIVSIAKLEGHHPQFNVILTEEGFIRNAISKKGRFNVIRRQDLEDVYFFDGTIYISETETLMKKRTFYHDKTLGYVVPKWKSLEIDDICDFICAESILNNIEKIKNSSKDGETREK